MIRLLLPLLLIGCKSAPKEWKTTVISGKDTIVIDHRGIEDVTKSRGTHGWIDSAGNWTLEFTNVVYYYDTVLYFPKGRYNLDEGCIHSKRFVITDGSGNINIMENKEIIINQ